MNTIRLPWPTAKRIKGEEAMEKKTYEKPVMEIVTFETADVITTSPDTQLPPFGEDDLY